MRCLCVLLLLMLCSPAAFCADVPEVFAGKLLDATGASVGGATVWLTTEDWGNGEGPTILARSETADNGSFRFVGFPAAPEDPGLYNVVAYKQGWAFAWSDRMRHARRNIRLTLGREFPLQGRIVGPDGKPVAGLQPMVSFLTHRPGFDPLAIGTLSSAFAPPPAVSDLMVTPTDETGHFRVRGIPPGSRMSLKVTDERFAHTSVRLAWGELREGRPIEIALAPPATIRGRVLNAEGGTPRPGVSVGLYAGGGTTADANGRYEFRNLRPGVHHVYLHELPRQFTARAVSDVKVEPGATVENVDLLIERGVTIRGRATAQGTDEPIADYGICCNTQQQPRVGSAWPIIKTGADGRYSLQAPEGEAKLRPFDLPEGWLSAIPHSRIGHDRRFDVSAQQEPIEINFEAVRACSVSGEVLDPELQGAAGATVLLRHPDLLVADRSAETDEDGRFSFHGLRPGTEYSLWAYRGDDMTLEGQKVTAGGDGPVTLRLDAGARPAVTGRAIGEDGRPASYALVIPIPWVPEAPSNCALADDQGRFVVRSIWPGVKGELRIQAGGYAEREVELAALVPGEERDVGEIGLAVANMVVTGRVLKPDGSPMAGVRVEVWARMGRFPHPSMTSTDLQGRFRIEGLPREELYVSADQFKCHSSRELVAPGKTDVVITATPWDELILFRHPLQPPLKRKAGELTATLHGLYRVKAIAQDGTAEQCLGLELQAMVARREGERGVVPTIHVSDNEGRKLAGVRASAKVHLRSLELYQLPEADASSLTIEVGQQFEGYGEPILFEPLEPMAPIPNNGLVVMLGKLELTDEWIPPGRGSRDAAQLLPPYLLARVYVLASRSTSCRLAARVIDGGPELIAKEEIFYSPGSSALGCVFRVSFDQGRNKIYRLMPMRYGPAWVAGIKPGDRLLGCDGIEAEDQREMLRYIREQPAGTEVTLRVRRGEQEIEIPVVLRKWQEDFVAEAQQALLMLRQWAQEAAEESTLMCYELQSTGGHGPMPLPQALSVSVRPYVRETVAEVTFDRVPLPEELRRR